MRVKIGIEPNAYIYWVLLLFFVPIKWLLAWTLAAGFHELCHWIAVKLCGGEICSVTIGVGGAKMQCSPMSDRKILFSILWGPFGGLLLVLFARWIPRVALCSWFLSVYNLLPLYPLDGGRALEILLGERSVLVQKVFLSAISIGSLYLAFKLRFGFLPLGIVGVLWLKSRNNPCKQRVCKVQ